MGCVVARLQHLMAALPLLLGSVVTGCFPLFSPGCGGGAGCCGPVGCAGPGYDPSAYSMPSYGPAYPPYSAAKSRSMAMAASNLDSLCLRRYANTRLSACALPFESRTPSDEQQCQRHCANNSPRCRSFQYDPAGSVCDLFEHSLGDAGSDESQNRVLTTTTSNQFGSFEDEWNSKKQQKQKSGKRTSSSLLHQRRKRFFLHSGVPLDKQSQQMVQNPLMPVLASGVGMAYSPSSPPSSSFLPSLSSPSSSSLSSFLHSFPCVPTLESRPGSVFVAFDSDCETSTANPFSLSDNDGFGSDEEDDNNQIPIPLPPPPPPPTPPPSPPYSRGSSSSSGSLEPFSPSSYAPSTSPSGSSPSSAGVHRHWVSGGLADMEVQKAETVDCADGTRARVQLIDGIALTGQQATARLKADSADVCLHVCRQNALLDGRRLSVPCRASTFHRQTGHCELLSDAISPNGALQYVPNPDSLYFEKLCIPRNELAPGCDDVIHRIPQHHLDPRQVPDGGTVETAQTQLECIRKCIAAKIRSGFDCVSASFFFDWPSQNCYMSRFTRLSRPDLYAAERTHLVDYMEMPPCFQIQVRTSPRQHDVPTEPTPALFSTAGAWSSCVGGMRWRKTSRNCTESGNGCVEKEQCGEKAEKSDRPNGPIGLKPIAPSIEVAKKFHAPPVDSEEASLFGEQDYENQKEISFFGPPHQPQHTTEHRQLRHNKDQNTNNELASCDPREQCCPIGGGAAEGPQGLVRGCSLGSRILEDGRTVSCVPNDCQ